MAWSAESRDEELMLGYCAGDAAAFDLLYQRHKGGLYRYLLRQCREGPVAEELFQDVWMNLVGARGAYTPSAKFSTYLYRVAHNRLIDHYRKHAGRAMLSYDDEAGPQLDEPAAPRNAQPDAAYQSKQRAGALLELIEALPEAQREAFLLQQDAGFSVEEIAAATSVTRETAKSRLRYALAKLRQGMGVWL
jgi:RNA polymerase sigma-70 factor, ECF subfamily